MNIRVKLTESNQKLSVKLTESNQKLRANFGAVQIVTEFLGDGKYTGDYIVTPKVEPQTLPTNGKVMGDDVTVKSIPFFNVSNTSGGSTVFIGSEV